MTDRFYELDVFCFKEVIHTAKRFAFKLPYTFSTHTSRSFICKENIPHSPVFRKHDPMKAGGWEHQSSRPPAFAFQFIGLFDQVRAELTDLFSFLRKHRPMPALLGLPVKVPGPVGLAVVLQLQRAAAGKNLCRIHKAIQRLLILPQNLYVINQCIRFQPLRGLALTAMIFFAVFPHRFHGLYAVVAQVRLNFSFGCLQRGQRQSSPRSSKATPSCSVGS